MWSAEDGDSKSCQHSCLENSMNSVKSQIDVTLKDESLRLVGVQYTTGKQWRNSSCKNNEAQPRWKQHPVVDMTGGESRI